MLCVTSISLGRQRLAVVNGVAEGHSIEIKTASGLVNARVTGIGDGVVHFKCGAQILDVRLSGCVELNPHR